MYIQFCMFSFELIGSLGFILFVVIHIMHKILRGSGHKGARVVRLHAHCASVLRSKLPYYNGHVFFRWFLNLHLKESVVEQDQERAEFVAKFMPTASTTHEYRQCPPLNSIAWLPRH